VIAVRAREGDEDVGAPDVSFIHFGRNDDYVPGIVDKLAHSIEVLSQQIAARRMRAEILVVDWNPPADRPPLCDVLQSAISDAHGVPITAITVPRERHADVPASDVSPVSVPIAVNVALRRARGRFCVVRASDVYYCDALMDVLASGDLDPSCVYRCLRRDIEIDFEELRRLPAAEVPAAVAAQGRPVHDYLHLEPPRYPAVADLYTNASGDFLLASRAAFDRIRGFREGLGAASVDHDGLALNCLVALGLRQAIVPEAVVYKLSHGRHTRLRVQSERRDQQSVRKTALYARLTKMMLQRGLEVQPFSDVFDFWIGLLQDQPQRSVGRGYHVYSYYRYLLYCHVLWRRYVHGRPSAPFHGLIQVPASGRLSFYATIFLQCARYIVATRPDELSRAAYYGGVARTVAACLWHRYRPRGYVFNGPRWGLSDVRLAMRRLSIDVKP
jgi:hypothetical protein